MYSSFFGFDIGRLSISIMMSRTENGRQTKRTPRVSSKRSMRMTVRNVYMLPMENQKSIGSDCGIRFGSVQRLELDDRGAVIVTDPERHRRRRVVDEDT